MFTKYGYSTLSIIAVVTLALILTGLFIQNYLIKNVIVILPLFFLLFSLYFFRDPDRTPPDKENVVLSPADGKIILIKDVLDEEYLKGRGRQVSIFMSPLNVHVNRIPVSGIVNYLKYFKGEYIAAFEDKASERNERAIFGIENDYGKVLFTQVAGFIARRIIYNIKLGDNVVMGNRFGMIKFGSRVDVVVPENWQVKVKMGDKVLAGKSILFEYVKQI